MGLLRYQVKPADWDHMDKESRERARELMIAEGGSTLGDRPYPILRFEMPLMAEAVSQRLKERAPQIKWGVYYHDVS